MEVSEARIAANKANSLKSTGPSDQGKLISRKNALKHGLTGDGIVLLEGDHAEVELRVADLQADLRPRSPLGPLLIRKIALLSLRSERSAEREISMVAERVRNAVEDFDQARCDRADALLDALQDHPRVNLRKLKRMPEGVDRLLKAWRGLRDDLAIRGRLVWSGSHLSRAAILLGDRVEHAQGTRVGALSSAIWGDFFALSDLDGAGLDDAARREWARDQMLGLVDAEIADLVAHRGTLDHDRIERDRREAPARATFDDSKEATLSRRYEADADRGFYKALKEFRQAESEAKAQLDATPSRPAMPLSEARMASSWEGMASPDRGAGEDLLDLLEDEGPVVRGSDGRPLSITRPSRPPG